MITLHIEATDINDLIQQIGAALNRDFTAKPAAAAAAPEPAPASAAPAEVVLPHAADKKPGRNKKTEAPAPAPAPAPVSPAPASAAPDPVPLVPEAASAAPPSADVAEPDPAAGASFTPADCRAALVPVNEKHGMVAAVAVLAKFGVERVSLVPEDKRGEFIAACKAKAAEAVAA